MPTQSLPCNTSKELNISNYIFPSYISVEVIGSIRSLRGDSEYVLTTGHSNINPC